MLKSARLIAFAATANAPQAKTFYVGTLGLKLVRDEEFALVLDAGGTMLRLAKVEAFTPAPYTVLGWEVPDLFKAVSELVRNGVQFERYDDYDQDALGIVGFPDGTSVAWFKDPDGNLLSLTQFG